MAQKTITVATANGNTTVNQMLTTALNNIKNIQLSDLHSEASYMKLLGISVPNGNGNNSTINNMEYSGVVEYATTLELSSMEFVRILHNAANGKAVIYCVRLSSDNTNQFNGIVLNDGTIIDYLNNKPASGLTVTVKIEYYA